MKTLETFLENQHHHLVHRRHEQLKTAGKNPSLADLQIELTIRDGLFLPVTEVGELLAEPLQSGRRGFSKKSEQAHSASCRAANLSAEAMDEAGHNDAAKGHADAARAHKVATAYHEEQENFHLAEANPTQADESSQPEETPGGTPLSCARALPSLLGDDDAAALPPFIMVMPGGVHWITPSLAGSGKPVTVVVEVNEVSAEQLEKQRAGLAASGNRPFFSIQHESDIAAFWVGRIFWDTRKDATGKMVAGVWADGEWTAAGREAVTGKNFRTFSPVFFVNKIATDETKPAQVICNLDARLNMGAFVNEPAFTNISPLWSDTRETARA